MDIASMITNPTAKKVPRPLNCFMTYRLEKQREILLQCPGTNHRDISKITAKWWKEMSAVEKEPYRIKAYNAKFEHEKKYPNYKFNPKKKMTKTRAYKKRSDDIYSLQDIEQQQKLYTLYHQGNIKSEPLEEEQQQQITTTTVKEDICCANCYSTSKTCFSKPNFTFDKRNSTESSHTNTSTMTSTSYYDYRASRCYGPTSTNQPYSTLRVPAIRPIEEYYSEPSSNRPFRSLVHSSYSPPTVSTFYYYR